MLIEGVSHTEKAGETSKEETSKEEAPKGEPSEEPDKLAVKSAEERPEPRYRKFLIGGAVFIFSLVVIYLGLAHYFKTHFYFGTEINGIDVSGKTLDDAKKIISAKVNAYMLRIKERGGQIEQIKAHEVGLNYSSDEELKRIKDEQKGFKWVLACFDAEASKKAVALEFDNRLLQERIDRLSCFNPSNIVEPKNPSFKYADKGYVIGDEILGNKVDKVILKSRVADALRNMKAVTDLESTGCYVRPQYNSKSPRVIGIWNMLNKYAATEIAYVFGQGTVTLDGSQINQWLTIDEDLKVTINEAKVKDYIDGLSNTYNTVGKTRVFLTSAGQRIRVSGGDYGRAIDKVKETQFLIAAIKEGKTVTKEPVFKQNAFAYGSNDIGNTYVEISLAKQHLWFYKNGSLVTQGDVVTGNVSRNRATHKGIYRLKYKARNVVLKGPDYAVPVTFWMPFDGGIGIHDASWRVRFGYNIYKTNGSHGCVNAPYSLAKKIFDNIAVGTPVICY